MPSIFTRVRPARRNRLPVSSFESLEARQFLSATVVQAPPAVSGVTGGTFAVDLSTYLDDPAINSQIRFATELGNIDLELFDQQKPITVTNFLKYVRQGRLDSTIIHRATEASTGLEVLQGGGYKPPSFEHIATDAGITNEASLAPVLSNTRGTISMARSSDPNSATSEFFINSVNNTSLDPSAQPPGYAVFGQVINNGLTIVDQIQALPTFAFNSPFGEIPLRNYTQNDFTAKPPKVPTAENFVSITATTLPKLTFNVTSDNPAIATPTLSGNKLTLQYGQTVGTANITVTGTDAQGQSVTQTFAATVAQAPSLTVTLGTGGTNSVTYTDTDGTIATLSYKGAGAATVTFDGTGLTQASSKGKTTVTGSATIDSIAITNASASTAVTLTGKGGNSTVDVDSLTASTALKSISGKVVNLTGELNVSGPVGKVDLGSVSAATIALGGAATDKGGAVTLGTATDTSITSTAPLKSVSATSFRSTSTRGTITAPALDKLATKGEFTQNVSVAGAIKSISIAGNFTGDVSADSISAVAVKGAMSGSTIAANRAFVAGDKPLGKVSVSGAITNSVIRAAGNITSVAAASIAGSTIYAGVAPAIGVTALPASTADFSAQATLGSLKIKTSTANSNIAAFVLGKIALGAVTPANGGTPFGLAADAITAATGSVSGTKLALKKVAIQADVTAQTTGLTLQDFQIVVI